jgi:DNA primase
MNSTPLIEFVLQEIVGGFEVSNPHAKNEALKECVKYLDSLNPVVATEYISFVAQLLQVSKSYINLGSSKKRIQPVAHFVKSTIEESIFLTMYLHMNNPKRDVRAWVDYTCPIEAWGDKELYKAIMAGEIDDRGMSKILVNSSVVELNIEQLMSLVKGKYRDYLKKSLKNSNSFDEILMINEKIKKVS